MPFTKGHKIVGNRNGRPKGSKNKWSQELLQEFLKSMKEVEKDKKISGGNTFFKHIITRGFKSDTVAVALLKKLVPDMNFNIEDFRNSNIKVTFELVEAKKKEAKENKKDKE